MLCNGKLSQTKLGSSVLQMGSREKQSPLVFDLNMLEILEILKILCV